MSIVEAKLSQPALRVHDGWSHQLQGYHFARMRSGSMLAMGMGTGKSKTAIDLISNWGYSRVLIQCPKSVLGVWRREFDRHWPKGELDLRVLVLDRGTTKEKAEQVRKFIAAPHAAGATNVVVVNYDTVWREPLGSILQSLDFHVVVNDEAHRIKAPGGKASRWNQKTGALAQKRLCLTGTPMPHSPLDLYGQFRFMAPMVFGTSYARFRARYALVDDRFPSQVRQWLNQDDLMDRFHANSYVCRSEDVLDLPGVLHETRDIELTGKARRVYDQLKNDFVAEVTSGVVTVSNALTRLLRLQQVTGGFVCGKDDADEQFVEELGTDKADALADIIEDAGEPVVVFCRFKHDLDHVRKATARAGLNYGELSGRCRSAIDDHACMATNVDVAGVQIQAGGVGVDLTRAAIAVYYSVGFSLGDYLQSVARLDRPGQTRCVRCYHLVASRTVDATVYKALRERRELVDAVMDAASRGD